MKKNENSSKHSGVPQGYFKSGGGPTTPSMPLCALCLDAFLDRGSQWNEIFTGCRSLNEDGMDFPN